eukprot:COSAG02_NODE_31164_length_538_cov_1.004556_1_plen_57_part_10
MQKRIPSIWKVFVVQGYRTVPYITFESLGSIHNHASNPPSDVDITRKAARVRACTSA